MARSFNRRRLFGLLAGSFAVPVIARGQSVETSVARRVQTVIDLIPPEPRARESNSDYPAWSDEYVVTGDAFSANGRSLHWQLGLAPVAWARWLLLWNAQGDPFNGVRLVDSAGNNELIAEITGESYAHPRCSGVILTDALNLARERGAWQFVLQQKRGNPVIFASSLEIVWSAP